MSARLAYAASLLSTLLASSLAHAQAPGEMPPPYDPPAYTPPPPPAYAPPPPAAYAPPPPVLVAAPRPSVMDNRWALGLSLGSMGLSAHEHDDATMFAVGELSLRFRATPNFELELAGGGGREQRDNGNEGDLEISTVTLGARFRINPEAPWNWYLMGGIGAAAVTFHDPTDQERKDATHPMAMAGVGVERRFEHFALQAEARLIGIAERDRDDDVMTLDAQPAVPTTTDPRTKLSGGSISIGASYYF